MNLYQNLKHSLIVGVKIFCVCVHMWVFSSFFYYISMFKFAFDTTNAYYKYNWVYSQSVSQNCITNILSID